MGSMAQGPYTITVQGTLANCSPGDTIVVHTGPGIVPIQGTAVAVNEDCSYSATITLDASSGSIVVQGFCGITHVVGDTLDFSFNTQVTDTTFWVNLDCNTGSPGDCQACYTVAEDSPFTATFTTCSSSGTAGPYMYTWDFSGAGGGTEVGSIIPHSFPGAGQYTVCHSIMDPDGCTSTVCHTVYVNEQGHVSLTAPPFCQACFTVEQAQGGGMLTPFLANFISCSDTAGGDVSFNWEFPDGVTASGEFATWLFTSPGAYEVCLVSDSANVCQSTFCDTVYVDSTGLISTTAPWHDCLGVLNGTALPGSPCDDGDPATVQDRWDASCNCAGIPCVPLPDPLTLNLGPVADVCSTDSIFQGVVENLQPGMYPVHYAWSGPGVTALDTLPWIQLFEPGNFHLTLSNACSTSEADFVITIHQAPDAGISGSITVCSTSDPFSMFGALDGTPETGGTWTGPNGDPALPIFDPAVMPAGVYTYTVPGASPCPNASATLTVFIDDDQYWYADADGDGLGDPDVSVTACEQPAGYVANADDACPELYGTVGDACEDGNPTTMNDVITEDCICEGTSLAVDCLGMPNGTALPGTACTISGGGMQITGTWTMDCVCDTTSTDPDDCQAGFWAIQAYDFDTLNSGGATPIPNEIWVWNQSSSGNGTYQFLWDFGDGNTSTEAYPTHEYNGPGPYLLCLTVVSGTCTDTYCDSISIDENGFLNGMVLDGHDVYRPSRSSGFTLRVIHSLPTGIAPVPALGDVRLWPNPAGTQVNLSFTSRHVGALPVIIMDLGGRITWNGTLDAPGGSHTETINVEQLRAGSYFLQVGEGGNKVMLRFIKM